MFSECIARAFCGWVKGFPRVSGVMVVFKGLLKGPLFRVFYLK